MFFRQYELGCLSLYSYLVGDEATGRAVVVDPQRDVSHYLADAEAHGLKIERVVETHFHADFLSGHLELAAATGAAVSYGPGAQADFPIEHVADGQRIALGDDVELEILHTPGHTPESVSVVIREGGEPWGVLTGDTLFIGDVGRPDLLGAVGWTPDDLARLLYRSLHDRLLALPDHTRVFPAHGAGSACGKNMSSAPQSTIGEQRATNYALQPMTEDAFVHAVTEGQSVAPLYFGFAASANRHAHGLLDDHDAPPLLDLTDVQQAVSQGAVLLDTRPHEVFASGHLRGAVNVGLDGRFSEYAGDVVRGGDPIVVVADRGRELEARVRLARIGFDDVPGALVDVERVLIEHPDLAAAALRLTAAELAPDVADVQLVDVRGPGEQESGVLPGASPIPLPALLDRLHDLDPAARTVVYCAGGFRSSAAASLLRAKGFADVADVLGGIEAWRAAGLPVQQP